MIYIVTREHEHIVILEPQNLKQIREGVVHTPPQAIPRFLITYSPDIEWTSARIKEAVEDGAIGASELQEIIREGHQRAEVATRPHHQIEVIAQKKPQ